MFRITKDLSSGSFVHCLAKNFKNDSIVSVDMDKVGVMAAYSEPLCVYRQCTCDGNMVTWRPVRATIVAVEKH